jgi:stearoyl-CoA desaturase (delta-9 desaturase)
MQTRKTQKAKSPSIATRCLAQFLLWFDTHASSSTSEATLNKDSVEWTRCIPFVVLHLSCLGVLIVGWSWFAIGLAAVLYFFRMFAVTAFFHRYFAHRAFKTSRWAQFLFALWGGTAVQRGALWWAGHHRHHHRHSDKETDTHSPSRRGFWWAHIGWFTCSKNFHTDYSQIRDFAKYPELVFLNRFDSLVPLVFAAGLFGIGWLLEGFAPGLGTNGPQLFIWGFCVSTIVLFHNTCFINSLAHIIGKKRFQTNDESRNSLTLALLTMGEGWHNNHHFFMNSARQGFYWWEIDMTFYVLKLFERCGLIWDLNPVPSRVYEQARVEARTRSQGIDGDANKVVRLDESL